MVRFTRTLRASENLTSPFVLEDERASRVTSLKSTDTRAFEGCLERDWWPSLRVNHLRTRRVNRPDAWTPDQLAPTSSITPCPAPGGRGRAYPAHLHMNLDPRRRVEAKERDSAPRRMARARKRPGRPSVHLGTNPGNDRALAF